MHYWGQINLQDPMNNTFLFTKMFHEYIMLMLIFLSLLCFFIWLLLFTNSTVLLSYNHNEILEIAYTLMPFLFLLIMGIMSINLLYTNEENNVGFDMTLKITGHQWYWSYEYSDFENMQLDSYLSNMINTDNDFYLLNTDNHIILPNDSIIRLVSNSDDVIHSWTIPSLCVKMDVMPGRLNIMNMFLKTTGLYFGQCSEICGVNHAFMPISLEILNWNYFMKWLSTIC